MKKRQMIDFSDYLFNELRDPEFREGFLQKREELEIGIEIAHLRDKIGISQAELARRAGMHRQNLARIERPNYRSCTIKTLERIARVLGHKLKISFVPVETTVSIGIKVPQSPILRRSTRRKSIRKAARVR